MNDKIAGYDIDELERLTSELPAVLARLRQLEAWVVLVRPLLLRRAHGAHYCNSKDCVDNTANEAHDRVVAASIAEVEEVR
jgi:hypothetical protein